MLSPSDDLSNPRFSLEGRLPSEFKMTLEGSAEEPLRSFMRSAVKEARSFDLQQEKLRGIQNQSLDFVQYQTNIFWLNLVSSHHE